jgi:YfiH family protein
VAQPPATVELLSSVPGLVHGFGRRLDGGRFETRDENRSRVAQLLARHGRLHLMKQVHGVTVVEAPWPEPTEADAGISALPGELVGIKTADCLPVLLVDPRRREVAGAHAGWRGTAAGVCLQALQALLSRGSRVDDVLAALGPCIGPCCYEVGDDVRSAFAREADHVLRAAAGARPHLDLREANGRQLVAAGVKAGSIARIEECTRCRPDLYHSYRREGGAAGRMISYVGFSAAP